jgi:hypothetical protein
MAKRTVTVDDIDGSPDAKTFHFSVEKDAYEIDLGEQNAAQLRELLAPFIDKARKVSRPARRRSADTEGSSQAVRDWAAANGVDVPPRGRIPKAVMDQYNAR